MARTILSIKFAARADDVFGATVIQMGTQHGYVVQAHHNIYAMRLNHKLAVLTAAVFITVAACGLVTLADDAVFDETEVLCCFDTAYPRYHPGMQPPAPNELYMHHL